MADQNSLSSIQDKICAFVRQIGITVEERSLPTNTFLPGLALASNCIYVDSTQLKHPGDILHEAGHLAVTTTSQRKAVGTADIVEPFPSDGEEIAAILWSYAAAVHLGLPLEILFHADGYKGNSNWLIENFNSGTYIGLPLLEWMGLALSEPRARLESKDPYPVMLRWLRA